MKTQKKQDWSIGAKVCVGFVGDLQIIGQQKNGDWLLSNRDGSKLYGFVGYRGLYVVGREA